jgi:polyphenol oxidase
VNGRLAPLDATRSLVSVDLPAGIVGLFTTRYGGTSTGPWRELNLGLHVEDDPARVRLNRELVSTHLGVPHLSLPHQVHGSTVQRAPADRARSSGTADARDGGADALVSSAPMTAIGVLVADCLPVILADSVRGVVGAAHVGRRGLVAGILQATVAAMTESGSRAEDVVAVIGPGVCGRCYEVPARMREEVEAVVPGSAASTRRGSPSLDLAAGASLILRGLGVGAIRATGICTVEDPRFYSYRREGRTGRFAGVVMRTASADG